MAVLHVKKFNLDYKGKRYKAGDLVQMSDVEAKKLASSAPGEFEIIEVKDIVEKEKAPEAETPEVENIEDVEDEEDMKLPSVDPKLAIKK